MGQLNRTALLSLALAMSLGACNAAGAGQGEAQDAPAQTSPVQSADGSQSGLEVTPLTIVSNGKTHTFNVEIARSEAQQERGLMFRKQLADDQGMIFPYKIPRIMSFWMRNTVIPLDLIFVRADGTIESIAANAVPYSLDAIRSGEPVRSGAGNPWRACRTDGYQGRRHSQLEGQPGGTVRKLSLR